ILDRDAVARIALHAHGADLTVEVIAHLVADHLLVAVVGGAALGFGGGIGRTVLDVFLDLVARIATGGGAGHGGDLLAVAAAHLVAKQAAGHHADHRPGDLVLVTDRLLACHGHVLADLTRSAYHCHHRLDAHHLGILQSVIHAVGCEVFSSRHGHVSEPNLVS